MRLRFVTIVPVLAIALTACGGGSGTKNTGASAPANPQTRLTTPSAPLTEVGIDCPKFAEAAQKIVSAQASIYTGAKADVAQALEALKTELAALKDGAPADVSAAIDQLSAAYDQIVQIRNGDMTGEATTKLRELGAELGQDGQKITTYIVSRCH